ncbi:MAG: hypothetical protein IJ350_05895 [Clostridia bacterium]|nr:hypothetical protein [Clostridia bacterium]
MLMTGRADTLPAFEQAGRLLGRDIASDSFALLWTAMVIPGAFLTSVPARLCRRGEKAPRTTLQSCLMALAGGVLLTLGMGLAGGNVLAGLFQGSASAYAFLLAAWAAGFIALRLGRRRA